ncbi:MAG: ATPase, T2SS/T4P/T4SS family, partial [Planctomycetia bacterium]|nr:ATPase, T2SS/T4P/T4SS family [Planctomycetia bacterium]
FRKRLYGVFSFFFMFLVVVSVFFAVPSRSEAQPPSKAPALKRLFSQEEQNKIQDMGNKIKNEGWRKEKAGHYFSIVKIFILIVVFWLWVATTSWANNDAERLGDPDRSYWNGLQVAIFPASFIPALIVPIFWVSLPIIILTWFVPMMCYVSHRNAPLLDADKVMTPEHIIFVFRKMLGLKVAPKKMAYELGSPIRLKSGGKHVDDQTKSARTILARNMPGFNPFREILYNSLKRNATAVVLTFEPETVKIQFQLDGVRHPTEGIFRRPLTAEDSTQIADAVKTLVGANIEDKKSRQFGLFHIEYDKKGKADAEFISQGTPSGEQFAIRYMIKKIPFSTLDQIGMYPDRQKKFRELLNADRGVFVISAQNGQGLKTLTNVAFSVADRFTRDFATVEDVQNPYLGIENVTLTTYDSAKGQKALDVLPDVFFREPKVVLLRDLGGPETLKLCCEEVDNDRVIITTFRGKDSVDTLMKLIATGVDHKLLAKTLTGIVTQKLVRLLCETCKEEIPANAQVLQRLGLKPGSVEALYRKRVHPEPEPGKRDNYVPCKVCQEIGYLGRTAIFDFLEITPELREIIANDPTEAAIRQAVLKSGQRGYLVDGARLVADGLTSFEEFARCMK